MSKLLRTACVAFVLGGAALTALALEPAETHGPLKVFNNEDFTLAFDTMLGAGDQQRALAIARQAVAHRPKDIAWRRRLAQVAEWTRQPALAAEHWSAMFVMGEHSSATVDAVLRLALLLEDPHLALQAWALRDAQTPLSAAQWADVYALYELLGEPTQGSTFFEAQYRKGLPTYLLEYAARLAENSGDDARAANLDFERSQIAPYPTDAVVQFATRLVRMDRLPQALDLMHRHAAQVPENSPVYWKLMGELAWQLGDKAGAQRAYNNIASTPLATAADWTRLIALMRQDHPAQAAELALGSFRRFGLLDSLLLALDLYAQAGDWGAQERVFRALEPKELLAAQASARFLAMRAQWHQRSNQPDLALADLQRALVLAPQDNELKLAMLWFLIDQQRLPELQNALEQYRAVAVDDGTFWPACAVASQLLGRTREALGWYRKEVQKNPDDPLLLLNFADTLESVQQPGMAQRVRRHAWLLLRSRPQQAEPANPTELLAVARLAISNQPGDPALGVVRQLAEKMRGLPSEQSDAQSAELVLGWALAKEQYANARAWMWLRFARQSGTAPLWAQSQLLLEQNDTVGMRQLLAEKGNALPVANHYDMAYAVGDVRQALDLLKAERPPSQASEMLHERARQHVPVYANYVQATASFEGISAQEDPQGRIGTLDSRTLQIEARIAPWQQTPGLQLLAGWSHSAQSSDNPFYYDPLPGADRLHRLELRWLQPESQSGVAVFDRNAVQGSAGFSLDHAWRVNQRVNMDAGLDYHAPSALSLPMRLTGFENSVQSALVYTLSKREYVRLAPSVSEYFSQSGDQLGSAVQLDLEAGYRLRSDYPDWRVRLLGSRQLRQANDGVDPIVIPGSGTSWSVCVDMGENLAGQNVRSVYSRAWRPFADVCLLNNMTTGADGYSASLGLAGSVTGKDHLSLEVGGAEDSATGSASLRSLSLRYRYYF